MASLKQRRKNYDYPLLSKVDASEVGNLTPFINQKLTRTNFIAGFTGAGVGITGSVLPFTKIIDTESSYNDTLYRYDIALQGSYYIYINLVIAPAGALASYNLQVRKNGVMIKEKTVNASTGIPELTMNIETVEQLTTTDYIDVFFLPSQAMTFPFSNNNLFGGFLI